MSVIKISKDYVAKMLNGQHVVPIGLADLFKYFNFNDAIEFKYEKLEDGSMLARSLNFRHGSIIATGINQAELEVNIKDAILTAFEVPSSYAKEAGIHRVNGKQERYAIA